jgi:hypothetical protein
VGCLRFQLQKIPAAFAALNGDYLAHAQAARESAHE